MARTSTNELTNKIIDWLLRQPRTLAWRNNVVGIPMKGGGMRSASRRGVGDILCVSEGGIFINIEVKIKGDRMRPEQVNFAKSVEKAGGKAIVVKDWEDFEKQWNSEIINKNQSIT